MALVPSIGLGQTEPRAAARGFGVQAASWPALIALALTDRLLKFLALRGITATLIYGHVLDFRLFANRGIAFSLPFAGVSYWLLAGPLLLLVGYGLLYACRRRDAAETYAFAAVLVGALSNAYDRVLHGFVTDYLMFFGRSAVNIADGLIVGGLVAVFLMEQKKKARPGDGARGETGGQLR